MEDKEAKIRAYALVLTPTRNKNPLRTMSRLHGAATSAMMAALWNPARAGFYGGSDIPRCYA